MQVGGSTLSQQLAKQLFTENVARNTLQRLFQKPIEWVIAVKLERYYTKEEILSMYLNKFDFLNNAVGIKTAAYTYFGCEPKDLKIEEAATLVGMCKNPSLYNPVRSTNVHVVVVMWCSSRCVKPDISQMQNVIHCRLFR